MEKKDKKKNKRTAKEHIKKLNKSLKKYYVTDEEINNLFSQK